MGALQKIMPAAPAAAASGFVEPAKPLALELFARMDNLPRTYFVHLASDNRNAPLIRAGEVVVVDQGGAHQGGWYPTDGGLFVIEYRSNPTHHHGQRYPRVSREVVQTYRNSRGHWHAGSMRRGAVDGMVYCSDGPYTDELHLADKLIGKVLGILAPMGVRI